MSDGYGLDILLCLIWTLSRISFSVVVYGQRTGKCERRSGFVGV